MPTKFLKQKNWFAFATTLALIILFIIRFYKLDVYPRGFFVDESSIAYNAVSIAQTGKDEHGVLFPVYFKAFGEFKNPILIYSQAILYTFLPSTIYTARLAVALWGLAFVTLIWAYTKKDRLELRLVKILLVATIPWLFHLSRINFEVIVYPTLVLASLIPLRHYFAKHQMKDWLFFVALITISFYSYTAGRLLTPLLLILAGVILIIHQRKNAISQLLFGTSLSLLLIIPAVAWSYYYPNSLLARYELVGKSDLPISQQINNIARTYREHTRLSYLFEVGDNNLRHSTGKGLLPLVTLPLFLIGLNQFWKKRKDPFIWFLLGGLALSPLPAALTWDDVPHALRSVLFVVFFIPIIFAGIDRTIKLKNGKKWLIAITIIILAEFFSYWSHYRTVYRTTNYKWFHVGDLENIVAMHERGEDFIITEDVFFGTYATAAYLYEYPPERMQQVVPSYRIKKIKFAEKN